MTFTYEISESEMLVYDHNNDKVATITNDGSGFAIPDDICEVMRDEAAKARINNNMSRWRDIHIRLADNDIAPKE